jgi:hypothetical protein
LLHLPCWTHGNPCRRRHVEHKSMSDLSGTHRIISPRWK